VDPDASRGGLSLKEVRKQLVEADDLYEKWGFNEAGPRGQALHDALFASEPIEWNRIGHFQDVTMRQIAERLLSDKDSTTYVDREIINQRLKPFAAPRKGYHVYCSALNPGAIELMHEVSREQGFSVHLEAVAHRKKATNTLHVKVAGEGQSECDRMLLYLTSQTWTRGEVSAALGAEVMKAMDLKVNVLLVHEMPGTGGQEARFGCEFGSLFSCANGATPSELLKRGIYSSIAVPLKGGAWREASMVLLGMALGMSKEAIEDAKEGGDVLGLGADTKLLAQSLKGLASSSFAKPARLLDASLQSVDASKSLATAEAEMSRLGLGQSGKISSTAISVANASAAESSSGGGEDVHGVTFV